MGSTATWHERTVLRQEAKDAQAAKVQRNILAASTGEARKKWQNTAQAKTRCMVGVQ